MPTMAYVRDTTTILRTRRYTLPVPTTDRRRILSHNSRPHRRWFSYYRNVRCVIHNACADMHSMTRSYAHATAMSAQPATARRNNATTSTSFTRFTLTTHEAHPTKRNPTSQTRCRSFEILGATAVKASPVPIELPVSARAILS